VPELPDVEVFRRTLARTSLHRKVERVRVRDQRLLRDVSMRTLARTLRGRILEATHAPPASWSRRRHHPIPEQGALRLLERPRTLDASSGDQIRHRLSRKGNRQINRVMHIMATVQLRHATEGRAYFDRRKAAGKTSNEAMRALKRRLSDIVYRHMVNDAARHVATGPGGQSGNDSDSSATDSHPNVGSSDKPLPRPANQTA
jgi:hypothetical protein